MLIVPILFFLSIFYFQKVIGDTECPLITIIEDRRIDKTKLRLVQFNVEWLFIDYYAAMDCPGNGCTWKNQSEAQIHLNTVAKIIDKLNPDIINLCEIEGCDELNMLKDVLSNGSSYTSYLKKGTDTATGQNVGLLTRVDPMVSLYRTESKYSYPIINSTCGYTGYPSSSGVSKHYITEFILDNMNIALISAHLIAIPTDPARCAQREAQAYVLQSVISEYINKDYEVILLGDFNDYDDEIVDANNDKPISKVLSILKGHFTDYTLYSIAETIVKQERYSDWWDSDNNCDTSSQSDYSMIDHILVTDAIRKNIINAFIYHEYTGSCTTYNSDHYPVVVDLVFTK